jgi:hypothetical protein
MSEEKKFKKLYIYVIVFFLITNIVAIFFVFKKYRNFNKQENKIASAKMKFAELRETFETSVDSSQMDSLYLNNLFDIKEEIIYVDSLLLTNQLEKVNFETLQSKIDDFVAKTHKIAEDSIAM